MIKINYKEPEQTETKDDIAKYNIKISEKYKKLDYLELSCISWLKIDKQRNYQNLEELFRTENLDSHVISQTVPNIPEGLEIGLPNKENSKTVNELDNELDKELDKKLEYVAKIICMNKEDSLNELLKYHLSYEENFECLKNTGCIMSINKDKSQEEEEKILQTKGVEEVKKILNCELKLEFELFKPMDSINFIIEDLKSKYGKCPQKIICGEIENDKVYALTIDEQIVSPIGWIEKKRVLDNINETNDINETNNINEKIECELIDFRKIKMERV
jgi:hypothetical protein